MRNARGAYGGFDVADGAEGGAAARPADIQPLQFVNFVNGVIPTAHYYVVSIPLKADVGDVGAIDPGTDLGRYGAGVQAITAGFVEGNGKG